VLAEFGEELRSLALENNVTIRYSASVGGALPALEAVTPNGTRPRAFKGIINGTCNFVIDQLAAGVDFDSAVRLAQSAGFAEADPTLDLNGTDAAQKVSLLARQSFGEILPVSEIQREGIDKLTPQDLSAARSRGNIYRLIAECVNTPDGIRASVKPVEISATHPFASVRGAENCIEIHTETGQVKTIRGRGAGRYATTESVMADLFDLRREFASRRTARYREVHA
jgi:homoserine dehydrogenase